MHVFKIKIGPQGVGMLNFPPLTGRNSKGTTNSRVCLPFNVDFKNAQPE